MILTSQYHTFVAQQVMTSIASGVAIPYLFIGQSEVWPAPASDSVPPAPIERVQHIFDCWHNMLEAHRVTANNMSFVIPRRDWTSGSVYDQYDDLDTALYTRRFYVLDTISQPYKVYKCLWNNNRLQSTVAPSTIGTALTPIETSDGYVWQYMYTIVDTDAVNFLTQQWMPVFTDLAVQANALNNAGKLSTAVPLIILDGGQKYNPAFPVTVTITGDGTGATASPAGVEILGGGVTRIHLSLGGLGYTHTNVAVFQSEATVQASVRTLIPPYPNHGYDPANELGASALIYSVNLVGDEDGNLTVLNQYRRIGIIINPLEAGGNVASNTIYRQTTDVTMSANTGVLAPNDSVVNITKSSASTADVVDVITIANTYVVRLTAVEPNGETIPFAVNDILKCVISGVEITVGSVSPPTLKPYTGQILAVHQRTPIARSADSSEEIKSVLQF
jgi:hypothetical protein